MSPGSWEGARSQGRLGITSKGIALTFSTLTKGCKDPTSLPSAWRIHLHPGWEFPKDYYTQASTSTRALIPLTGPKHLHLLRQWGHPRWSHLRLRSRVELPAVSPCLCPRLNGSGSAATEGVPTSRDGWWHLGAQGTPSHRGCVTPGHLGVGAFKKGDG